MSSELDKFTYSTTYRQDYKSSTGSGVEPTAEQGKVECRAKAHVGEATGRPYENPLGSCPCRAGGSIPPRGGVGVGLAGNFEKTCSVPQGGGAPTRPGVNKEDVAEMMYKTAEAGNAKGAPQPVRGAQQLQEPIQCPRQERFRPVAVGQFGGQFEGPMNREHADQPRHNDQAMPFAFDKPCTCLPGKPESGPQDYGQAWIRERAREGIEPRMTGGSAAAVPPDVARLINPEPPAARVSCAPESDVSKFDQPNTFMRKLYDKYPYLYQILRDTPPEELIARVFKDRFLSTYQVDYLHMGAGKEAFPKGGEQMNEKFVSPEGEPEPNTIPGCTYRASKKGEFGRKKSTLKVKEREDDDGEPELVKEEPRISEYMASISKLGGEIITEKLYLLESSNRKASAGKSHS